VAAVQVPDERVSTIGTDVDPDVAKPTATHEVDELHDTPVR
jgi:hypothetical protein